MFKVITTYDGVEQSTPDGGLACYPHQNKEGSLHDTSAMPGKAMEEYMCGPSHFSMIQRMLGKPLRVTIEVLDEVPVVQGNPMHANQIVPEPVTVT